MATKAAAGAVENAVVESVKRTAKAPFRVGEKKLYLPNHVVAFLRPKPGQSPTTATFKVPLTFNKFDFRDYLFHVYQVEVTSVRSFINQMRPQRRARPGGAGGQWYRPRSQKLMVVDLKKPFVWPERPAEDEMDEWDHKLFQAVEEGHNDDVRQATVRAGSGRPKMRTQLEENEDRARLREAAAALLSGKKKWVPGTWVEVEQEEEAEAVPAPLQAAVVEGEETQVEAETSSPLHSETGATRQADAEEKRP